jgi:hypothetical protein
MFICVLFLFQSECENLKGQLSALSEKYSALAMRHMQYKSKRKAQVEDLRYIMLLSPFISSRLLQSQNFILDVCSEITFSYT